jgi:hypothetical protein
MPTAGIELLESIAGIRKSMEEFERGEGMPLKKGFQRIARVPTFNEVRWGGTAVRRRYGVEQLLLRHFLRLNIGFDSFDRSATSGCHIIRT